MLRDQGPTTLILLETRTLRDADTLLIVFLNLTVYHWCPAVYLVVVTRV